ncbi:MAG TPA: hypothetical protein PK048_00340 [Candidatus Absconditabacterales bacterium]|nr:hypothetical protein [Candidatus Absconditabacterales bacterium]
MALYQSIFYYFHRVMKRGTIAQWASIVFLVTTVHLGYQYLHDVSDRTPIKGGTMVEGIIGNLSYLPYTSKSQRDEFYQRLLFEGCVKIQVVSGSIEYHNNLCDVTTRDYKNYFVTLPREYRWIDNQIFGFDDVLFTYQAILKENLWKIPELSSYAKTEITQLDDQTLKVSFPKQSIDNMLFFTNSLLPKHSLENQTLDYYLKTFAKQPIYISCSVLDLVKSHDNNYIFDVSACQDLLPKIIQVKSFETEGQAVAYLQNPDSIIDYFVTDDHKASLFSTIDGVYTGQYLPSNTLYTLFFNINTVSESMRKQLAHVVGSYKYSNLVPPYSLFHLPALSGADLRATISSQITPTGTGTSGTLTSSFPFLPKNIWIFGKNKYKEYYLDEFRDKYLIQFKFDTKYDKVTIAANSPYEYTPDSYDAENKTCAYNLSIQFKNITKGVNYYTVYGYIGTQKTKLLTMKVHYGVKPDVLPTITKKTNYTLIYLDEPNSVRIIDHLKQLFVDQGIESYITWTSYPNFTEFEGKLASKGYDMVLLPLELGLKSDLSALFSDNIVINPSQYTNDRLIQLLQKYTNGNKTSSNEITTLYQKIYPFAMMGLLKQVLYVKSSYEDKLINQKYSINNFRTTLNNGLKTYDTIVIDWKKIMNRINIKNFVIKTLQSTF